MNKFYYKPIPYDTYISTYTPNNRNIKISTKLQYSKHPNEYKYGFNVEINKLNKFNNIYFLLLNFHEILTLEYSFKIFIIKTYKELGKLHNNNNNNNLITFRNNDIYIGNQQLIPITNNTTFSNNKYLKLFELFNENNLISNENISQTYLTFEIIGPFEIKNKTIHPVNDFIEVCELFRNKLLHINIPNTYINYYKIISWGENVQYNKIQNITPLNNKQIVINMNSVKKVTKKLSKKVNLVFIRKCEYISSNYCINENSSIHQLIIYITYSILNLNSGGKIILELSNIYTHVLVQLLYFISLHFYNIRFFISSLKSIQNCSKYIIFNGFIGISKYNIQLLLDIITDLNKKDPSIGENINTKKQYNYCKNVPFIKSEKEIFINNLFDIEIPQKFTEIIIDINNYCNNYLMKCIKKLTYIQNNLEKNNFNQNIINIILKANQTQSLKWCKYYDIKTLEIITENKLINDTELIKYYFPYEPNINMKKLQMSTVGLYSISTPKDAINITQVILKNINTNSKNLVITDGTSGIGGNIINFSLYFKEVHAVELDKLHYEILQNNIRIYDRKNVSVYNDSYLNVYNTIKQDIIFLDPPWTGIDYKEKTNLSLKLGKYELFEVVKMIKNVSKLIVLKVPINFDYQSFLKNITDGFIKLYKVRNYIIIVLINNATQTI